jgi:hypothetical protein
MFSKSKKSPTKYKPYLGAISEADELKWKKQEAIANLKPSDLMKLIHTLDEKKSTHTNYEAIPIPRDSNTIDYLYTPKPKNASDVLNNRTKYFSSNFLNNSAKSSSGDYKITAGYKRKSKHYKSKHYKSKHKHYKNTNRKTNRKKNTQFRRTIRRLNKKTKNM